MNLNAMILAADSSATVKRWVNGKEEMRFYKGANKIFQLSDSEPVGLMFFGGASLQDIPWEVIVKDFRKSLGAKAFPELKGYADAFFDFVQGHTKLFPQSYRDKISVDEGLRAAFGYLYAANQLDAVKQAPDAGARKQAYRDYFDSTTQRVDNAALPDGFQEEDIQRALGRFTGPIVGELNGLPVPAEVDPTVLAALGIKGLIKHFAGFKNATGIVLAGYGRDEFFPGFIEYECHGFLLNKLLRAKKDERQIEVGTVSYVKPFAISDMIDTFLLGFSNDVFSKTSERADTELRALAEAIKIELNVPDIPNLERHIGDRLSAFRSGWTEAVTDQHFFPFRAVIGSLPVNEMAELVETLIMLESLKEKVTRPTETVGGPVDVAVISKSDGFVWIKRKHCFDPKFNPRFFARQRGAHG